MGLFSAVSPFDTDVEKATDEKNVGEDWSKIMDICDKVLASPSTGPKDCLRSIMGRARHPDPHVVLQALLLLDACVNNCGKTFHLEVASRDFETEYRRLVNRNQSRAVLDKLKGLLRKWAESPEFTKDPQLGLIPSLYKKLQHEDGIDFSDVAKSPEQSVKLSKDPNVVSSQQEEDDLAKAIELSLRESGGKSSTKSSGAGSSSLYPSALSLGATPSSSSSELKVKALYDFEAAEDNELSFHTGDIITVSDNSDPNWWKGSSQRGEGLFPANFVTTDLSESQPSKRSVQFSEAVQVKTLVPYEEEQPEPPPEINEEKIDRLLHTLHEADPTEDENGVDAGLERQVHAMGPLIDTELERVDRRHAQLTQLSGELVSAFNLYHLLMREQPKQMPPPPPQPYGAYMSPQHQGVYNGGGGMYPPPGVMYPPHPPQSMEAQYMQQPQSITQPFPQQQQQYHPASQQPLSYGPMPGGMQPPPSFPQPLPSHPQEYGPPPSMQPYSPPNPGMQQFPAAAAGGAPAGQTMM